ncbi:prolipoprotein diacylglyceryl transferase [candidate division WOR-3 bacterium]|nr:prolipoprotein diacylglyceryl transferase [candidate division WOR-3 bacterium]
MHPILLNLGSLQLYSYGVMLFISFICGIALAEHRARKFGVEPRKITDLALWVLVAVIVGSRLFYVAFHWDEFRHNLVEIVKFWGNPPGLSGLMFYGGLIGGFIAGLIFVRVNRLPVVKLMDAVMPGIMLGEGFTRIGCFLNGCCFGKECHGFPGMVFPAGSPAGARFHDAPIHPTQLYSSAAGFILFGIALILERRRFKDGVLFSVLLIAYSMFRFGIDFVRYYEDGANLWGNQVVSLALAGVGVALLILFQRRPRKQPPADEPGRRRA